MANMLLLLLMMLLPLFDLVALEIIVINNSYNIHGGSVYWVPTLREA